MSVVTTATFSAKQTTAMNVQVPVVSTKNAANN